MIQYPAIMQLKFNSHTRAAGESVSKYIAALRSLAEHCQYKDTLKEMLHDQLVVELIMMVYSNPCWQKKDGLTYEKALELALVIESAEKDTKEMNTANGKPFPAKDVYQFHTHPKPTKGKKKVFIPKKIVCYRGGGEHLAPDCKFKNAECHICKKSWTYFESMQEKANIDRI